MTPLRSLRPHRLAGRAVPLLCPTAAAAALADWLFWDHPIGLSVALFCAALAVVAHVARPSGSWPYRAVAFAALLAGLVPTVVNPGPLPMVFALLSTSFAAGLTPPRRPLRREIARATRAWFAGPRQALQDLSRHLRVRSRRPPAGEKRWAGKLVWVMPVMVAIVFLALFANANPLIAEALTTFPMLAMDDLPSPFRITFWIVVSVGVWPVLHPRRAVVRSGLRSGLPSKPLFPVLPATAVFGEAALLRTLALCNLLFVLQLALDGMYLWGGVDLPKGMTYAEYAHRGAYPLMAAALLAGGFVLCARRLEVSARLPRPLVSLLLVFIGFNVVLVINAMQRLGLYVAAYGLTEWRVAAFCWMALVAFGLSLMVVQVVARRSNDWLASCGLVTTLAVVYIWSLGDVPAFVARYDVAHCAEVAGSGPALDVHNLLGLGPAALPALDRFRQSAAFDGATSYLDAIRVDWAEKVANESGDWRGWSVETWRLARYLATVDAGATRRAGDGRTEP